MGLDVWMIVHIVLSVLLAVNTIWTFTYVNSASSGFT